MKQNIRHFFSLVGALLICATAAAAPAQSPEEISEEELATIQALMDGALVEGRANSAIAMISQGETFRWVGTAGEMGPDIVMRPDAIVPLASIGKMFTATAAMILVERGVLGLDDPISDYIPEFAELRIEHAAEDGSSELVAPDRPVTVRHLLTHTGGLRVSGNQYWDVWNPHAGNTTTTEFSRALATLPMASQPGEAFQYGYTGGSYEVLAAVIEIASGQTLEAFLNENLFEPLGMNDSYFYLPDEKLARRPAIYRIGDNGLEVDQAMGEPRPRSAYFFGGGGVESTANDLHRFGSMLLSEGQVDDVRILQSETVQLMMRDHLGALEGLSDGRRWGFGAAVRYETDEDGSTVLAQYGWEGGGFASFWIDPRRDLIAYIAFPLSPPGDNELLERFRTLVYSALADE